MQKMLMPIFKLRLNCFKESAGKPFYENYEDSIIRSSLAAQEYYFSEDLYKNPAEHAYKIPAYIKLHEKYGLTFDNKYAENSNYVNLNLVMNLTIALKNDINQGITNLNYDINYNLLKLSNILKVPHIAFTDFKDPHFEDTIADLKKIFILEIQK